MTITVNLYFLFTQKKKLEIRNIANEIPSQYINLILFGFLGNINRGFTRIKRSKFTLKTLFSKAIIQYSWIFCCFIAFFFTDLEGVDSTFFLNTSFHSITSRCARIRCSYLRACMWSVNILKVFSKQYSSSLGNRHVVPNTAWQIIVLLFTFIIFVGAFCLVVILHWTTRNLSFSRQSYCLTYKTPYFDFQNNCLTPELMYDTCH